MTQFRYFDSLLSDDRHSRLEEQKRLQQETNETAQKIADRLKGWDENWGSCKGILLEHELVNRFQELLNQNGADDLPQLRMVELTETLSQYYQRRKFFAHSFGWARAACQLLANDNIPRDPILFARTRFLLGQTLFHQGYPDEALVFFEQTLDTICNEIPKPLTTSVIELLYTCIDFVANVFLLSDDIPKATALAGFGLRGVRKRLLRLLPLLEEPRELPDPEFDRHIQALCAFNRNLLLTRADIYLLEGEAVRAKEIFEGLLALVRDDWDSNSPDVSRDETLETLRRYVIKHGVVRAVIARGGESEIRDELTNMGDVDALPWSETRAVAYVDLAALHHALGNSEEALVYYQKAEDLWNDTRPHETAHPFFSLYNAREEFSSDWKQFHCRIPTTVIALSIPYAYTTDTRNRGYREENFDIPSHYAGCEGIDSDDGWSNRLERLKNLELHGDSNVCWRFSASSLKQGRM